MSAFSRGLLKRADVQEEVAQQLFANSFPDPRAKERALAVVAKVTANIMRVLGESLEFSAGSDTQNKTAARRNAVLEKSNALRTAYADATASDDWSEYDRLAWGDGGGSSDGT